MIREVLFRILDAHPLLTKEGFDSPNYRNKAAHAAGLTSTQAFNLRREVAYGDDSLKEFALGLLYLAGRPQIEGLNRKITTYNYKHQAEKLPAATGYFKEYGSYVSNGMMIAAAYALGYDVVRCKDDSKSACLNIARENDDLYELSEAKLHSRYPATLSPERLLVKAGHGGINSHNLPTQGAKPTT